VQVVPAVLWVGLAGFVVVKLRGPLVDQVLPRLTGVKVVGVEFALRPADVQAAVTRPGVEAPPEAGAGILARAERAAPILRDAQVLWVDENEVVPTP
jgi:hypothetical protein